MWPFLSRHKCGITITVLTILLLISIAYSLYNDLDHAISASYRNTVLYDCSESHKAFQEIVDAMVKYDFRMLSPDDMLQLFPGSFLKDTRNAPYAPKTGTEYVVVWQHEIWFKDGVFAKVKGSTHCHK